MANPSSRIAELAQIISTGTNQVDQYLQSQNIASPSFNEDALKVMVLPDRTAESHRVAAISAAAELQDLLLGAHAAITPIINGTGLEAVYKWNIAAKVPKNGEISYADLSTLTGLRENTLRRVIRFCIPTHRLFQEKRDGYVSHSAASRLLSDNPDMYHTMGMMFAESWHAFTRTVESIDRYDSEEPNESAFSLALSPGKSVWEYYKDHPDEGRRFARSMEGLAKRPGYSVGPLVSDYPWSSLKLGAKVVDVGGGQGHASIAISKENSQLRFVVQDLPGVIEAAKKLPDVPEAVEFMEHDFFTEQPIQADLYLFRWVLHDWPDKYVVKILQALTTKLRTGAKVVINDSCMPPLGSLPLLNERRVRQYDMCMLALFNSKEREEHEWHELFRRADPRFQDIKSWTPPGAVLSIIEATWKDAP